MRGHQDTAISRVGPPFVPLPLGKKKYGPLQCSTKATAGF